MRQLTKTALATREQAVKFAKMIISSYPPYQRQGDHEMYYATFIDVLTGVPIPILESMMNPRTGLTRRLKWLPSISEIMDFIEGWDRKFKVTQGEPLSFGEEKFYDRNGKIRRNHTFEPPAPEIRECNLVMLNQLSKTIKETADATQRVNPKAVRPVQYTKDELDSMRLKALEYLESMRGGESQKETERD